MGARPPPGRSAPGGPGMRPTARPSCRLPHHARVVVERSVRRRRGPGTAGTHRVGILSRVRGQPVVEPEGDRPHHGGTDHVEPDQHRREVGEVLGVADEALDGHGGEEGQPGVLDAGRGVGAPEHPQQSQQQDPGGPHDLGVDADHVAQGQGDPLGAGSAGMGSRAGGGRPGGHGDHQQHQQGPGRPQGTAGHLQGAPARAVHGPGRGTLEVTSSALWTTRALLVLLVIAMTAGAATTGTGPHAGGPGAKRIPLALSDMVRIHAEIVWATGILLLALLWVLWRTNAPARVQNAGLTLLATMVVQGFIGYTQYFTHLPAVLVGFHVVGATVVWSVALWFHHGLSSHPREDADPVGPGGARATASADAPLDDHPSVVREPA